MNYSTAQRGMLVYDIQTGLLRNQTIDGYGNDDDGFQFGTLHWLPDRKGGKGLLVSLMSERHSVSRPNTTTDNLDGTEVSLQHVMIYDIEQQRWYNQTADASGFGNEPKTRTRFCTVVAYDADRRVHELSVFRPHVNQWGR